jgi:hypothetical protein
MDALEGVKGWSSDFQSVASSGKDVAEGFEDIKDLANVAKRLGAVGGALGIANVVLGLFVKSDQEQVIDAIKDLSIQIADLRHEMSDNFQHLEAVVQTESSKAKLQKACISLRALHLQVSHYMKGVHIDHKDIDAAAAILAVRDQEILEWVETIGENVKPQANEGATCADIFSQVYDSSHGHEKAIITLGTTLLAVTAGAIASYTLHERLEWEERQKSLDPEQHEREEDMKKRVRHTIEEVFAPVQKNVADSLSQAIQKCRDHGDRNIKYHLEHVIIPSLWDKMNHSFSPDTHLEILKQLKEWDNNVYDWLVMTADSQASGDPGSDPRCWCQDHMSYFEHFVAVLWVYKSPATSSDWAQPIDYVPTDFPCVEVRHWGRWHRIDSTNKPRCGEYHVHGPTRWEVNSLAGTYFEVPGVERSGHYMR